MPPAISATQRARPLGLRLRRDLNSGRIGLVGKPGRTISGKDPGYTVPARSTERRLPFEFGPNDAGENATSADGRFVLISFNNAPLTKDRLQRFAVFVTDEALASQMHEVEWRITLDGIQTTERTAVGYLRYVPAEQGRLTIESVLVDQGGQELGRTTLDLNVVDPNPQLEALIAQADESAPVAGRPATSREVINDIRAYIDELAPRDADTNGALNKLMFAIAYTAATHNPVERRARTLEHIADALGRGEPDAVAAQAVSGFGACGIRPHVLAMYLTDTTSGQPLSPRSSYPRDPSGRVAVDDGLLTSLAGLGEPTRIDLFNVLRFPKLSLRMTKLTLEAMAADRFPGETIADVLVDKAKALELIEQFQSGPLVTT